MSSPFLLDIHGQDIAWDIATLTQTQIRSGYKIRRRIVQKSPQRFIPSPMFFLKKWAIPGHFYRLFLVFSNKH